MGLNAAKVLVVKPDVRQVTTPAIKNLEQHSKRSAIPINEPKSDVMNWRADKEGKKSSFMSDMLTNNDS